METQEPISVAEASAALASVRQSRSRVAWTSYPSWYWFGTAAGLAVLVLTTSLPVWLGLVCVGLVTALLLALVVAANRARGVCEFWTRSAMRGRDITVLYGPSSALILAGSFAAPFVWWIPIVAAVLVFMLFAGTGLTLSARAARR